MNAEDVRLTFIFQDHPGKSASECLFLDFYRATLCVSAVFAVARCPSVCPFVTLVYCIQTAEDIIRLLSRLSSSIILVFDLERRYQIPRESLQRGCKIYRVGIFRFSTDIDRRLSWKRYEIVPWLLRNVNRKSQMTHPSVSVPMTLSDLERRDARCQIFRRICLITLVLFDLKTTKLVSITHVGRSVFLGVSHAPTTRGGRRAPSAAQFLRFPPIYAPTL